MNYDTGRVSCHGDVRKGVEKVIGLTGLITLGAQIDHGQEELLRSSQVRKRGEDWFEPVLNIRTPLFPTLTPISWTAPLQFWGATSWRVCSRHCATSPKVADSIPDGITGIFHWHYPSGHTMALGSTQPLTEISIRNISWRVKAGGAWGWQPYHLHLLTVLKSGSPKFLDP